MARTIRRTSDKRNNRNPYFADKTWWTHEHFYDEDGLWTWTKKEGKEYWKGYWRFHSDRIKHWSYPKAGRRPTTRTARYKNNREIHRFMRDEDYEVMLHEPRDLSWDY